MEERKINRLIVIDTSELSMSLHLFHLQICANAVTIICCDVLRMQHVVRLGFIYGDCSAIRGTGCPRPAFL